MKKFFILLIVVLMLAGLTFSSFAGQNGHEYANNQGEDGPPRDGTCLVSLDADDCVPDLDGDGPKYKWGWNK